MPVRYDLDIFPAFKLFVFYLNLTKIPGSYQVTSEKSGNVQFLQLLLQVERHIPTRFNL